MFRTFASDKLWGVHPPPPPGVILEDCLLETSGAKDIVWFVDILVDTWISLKHVHA